jgi:hypothetical protein
MYHIMIDEGSNINITMDNHNLQNKLNKNIEIQECPVCFENMNDLDGILIMECCNKKIHITCLIDWYTKNLEKNVCFMCNQSNKFCKDLVDNNSINNSSTKYEYPNVIQINSSSTEISISPIRTNSPIRIQRNENSPSSSKIFSNIKYCLCIISTVGGIILICVTSNIN